MSDKVTVHKRNKFYWQSSVSDTDCAKDTIRSWFSPLCDGMTPDKAEVLCDVDSNPPHMAEVIGRAIMEACRSA